MLGIIDTTLFIGPLYAGDHTHMADITLATKADLLERGVKEFNSYDDLESYLYGTPKWIDTDSDDFRDYQDLKNDSDLNALESQSPE